MPCIPSIPNEYLLDDGNTPKPIRVMVAGAPVSFTNSLTRFEAFNPELMQPPPI